MVPGGEPFFLARGQDRSLPVVGTMCRAAEYLITWQATKGPARTMDYWLLKTTHIACVAITAVLFFGRGLLMLAESPLRNARVLRIAPHVNDTVLLASALWMAVRSHQYPFAEAWLTAKLLALITYIGLGMVALTYGRTRRTRMAAWVAAQLVLAYIIAVALTRSALPIPSH